MVFTEHFRGASHISNAHGGGAGDTPEFSEAVHLHCAGKRHHHIRQAVQRLGKEADDHQKKDLDHQHDLAPVYPGVVLIKVMYPLGNIDAGQESC